jgi:hypothetical protein
MTRSAFLLTHAAVALAWAAVLKGLIAEHLPSQAAAPDLWLAPLLLVAVTLAALSWVAERLPALALASICALGVVTKVAFSALYLLHALAAGLQVPIHDLVLVRDGFDRPGILLALVVAAVGLALLPYTQIARSRR